jgi:Holliday junction resolvase
MTDFELEVENIVENLKKSKEKKKRKANPGEKGKRFERNLAKLLKKRFGFDFTRTLGSGNRWGQCTFLPAHAHQTFSGDLVCPDNYLWVIECKGGYDDIDVYTLLARGCHHEIDEWIEQSDKESERSGRKPIICWKKSYKSWLAMVKTEDLKDKPEIYLNYKEWSILALEKILAFDDGFFFKEDE